MFSKKKVVLASGFMGFMMVLLSSFSLSIAQQQTIAEISHVLSDFFARTYTSPQSTKVTIEYNLPARQKVKVVVYNSDKSFSRTLVNEWQEEGSYKVYFDGSERASGLYICKVTADKEVWIEPMLLIK